MNRSIDLPISTASEPNARVSKNAALMVKDSEAIDKVVPTIIELANDSNRQNELKRNIGMLAVTDADKRIAEEVLKLI